MDCHRIKTIIIQQDVPTIKKTDLPIVNQFHADIEITKGGKGRGILYGILINQIKLEKEFIHRYADLVFDFGLQGQIIASGIAKYPNPLDNFEEMQRSIPHTRSIIGGTHKFIGAKGQITSFRNENNTYTHKLEILRQ